VSPETRAGDAHAARTVAKSESLGTDSLIFCRCEPFETLSAALARKIFLRRKLSLGARGQVRSGARILKRDDATQARRRRAAHSRSARFIGTSRLDRILHDWVASQKYSIATFAMQSRDRAQ
jgi:hypothetical protein